MTAQEIQESRFDDFLCGVCARTSTGIGYSPRPKHRIIHVCDDKECIRIVKDSYNMKQEEFSRLERIAANDARFDAGDYMEKIGKSDLSVMTLEEAMNLCQVIVSAYRRNLKKLINDEAPF